MLGILRLRLARASLDFAQDGTGVEELHNRGPTNPGSIESCYSHAVATANLTRRIQPSTGNVFADLGPPQCRRGADQSPSMLPSNAGLAPANQIPPANASTPRTNPPNRR